MNFKYVKQLVKRITQYPITRSIVSIFNVSFGVGKRLIYLALLSLFLLLSTGVGIGLGYFANIISHTAVPSPENMKAQLGTLNQSYRHFENVM